MIIAVIYAAEAVAKRKPEKPEIIHSVNDTDILRVLLSGVERETFR